MKDELGLPYILSLSPDHMILHDYLLVFIWSPTFPDPSLLGLSGLRNCAAVVSGTFKDQG